MNTLRLIAALRNPPSISSHKVEQLSYHQRGQEYELEDTNSPDLFYLLVYQNAQLVSCAKKFLLRWAIRNRHDNGSYWFTDGCIRKYS